MPAKNVVKQYVENGIYHIYNRGVEKRRIFVDDDDYVLFLRILKEALSPVDTSKFLKQLEFKGVQFKGIPRQPKNFYGKIELLAYCLMPNHFHLMVKQIERKTINEFVQSISVRYSSIFNKKHKRVGSLFQSRYRAILVTEDPYLLHLSRYIHLNPRSQKNVTIPEYSSYPEYLGIRHSGWVNPHLILSYFSSKQLPITQQLNTYKSFVEKFAEDSELFLGNLTLEENDEQ